jgi:branched-chain amino acid transport system substrate-binding protein
MRLIVLLSVLALVAAACGGDDGASDTTSGDDGSSATTAAPPTETTAADAGCEAAAGEPIKFGMLIGVTGDYAPYYDVSKAGADVAITEINDAGGVLGRPVELVVVDNKSTVEGAVQGFSQIIDIENVDALGGPESDGAIANLQAIKDLQLPTAAIPL